MLKTDIAFKTDLNKGFLPFITAFMVFVASITYATALIGNSLASDWNSQKSRIKAAVSLGNRRLKAAIVSV